MQRPINCYLIGFGLLSYLTFSLVAILAIHLHEVPIIERTVLLRTSALCSAFGMLGSSIAAIRKYYKSLITEMNNSLLNSNEKQIFWDFGWTFYYLTRPILGAILGGLSFILVFFGFRILSTSQEQMISSQGNMMLYALSLLTGYSVSQVLDRLSAVASHVFDPTSVK